MKKTLEPTFNEKFEFHFADRAATESAKIQFRMRDHDTITKDDEMGVAVLDKLLSGKHKRALDLVTDSGENVGKLLVNVEVHDPSSVVKTKNENENKIKEKKNNDEEKIKPALILNKGEETKEEEKKKKIVQVTTTAAAPQDNPTTSEQVVIAKPTSTTTSTKKQEENPAQALQKCTTYVTVIRAENLPVKDMTVLGKKTSSDPYVILEVNDQRFQTKVVEACTSPTWNETFSIEFNTRQDCENATLQISLKDRDTITRDDALGTATLSGLDSMDYSSTIKLSSGGILYVRFFVFFCPFSSYLLTHSHIHSLTHPTPM